MAGFNPDSIFPPKEINEIINQKYGKYLYESFPNKPIAGSRELYRIPESVKQDMIRDYDNFGYVFTYFGFLNKKDPRVILYMKRKGTTLPGSENLSEKPNSTNFEVATIAPSNQYRNFLNQLGFTGSGYAFRESQRERYGTYLDNRIAGNIGWRKKDIINALVSSGLLKSVTPKRMLAGFGFKRTFAAVAGYPPSYYMPKSYYEMIYRKLFNTSSSSSSSVMALIPRPLSPRTSPIPLSPRIIQPSLVQPSLTQSLQSMSISQPVVTSQPTIISSTMGIPKPTPIFPSMIPSTTPKSITVSSAIPRAMVIPSATTSSMIPKPTPVFSSVGTASSTSSFIPKPSSVLPTYIPPKLSFVNPAAYTASMITSGLSEPLKRRQVTFQSQEEMLISEQITILCSQRMPIDEIEKKAYLYDVLTLARKMNILDLFPQDMITMTQDQICSILSSNVELGEEEFKISRR